MLLTSGSPVMALPENDPLRTPPSVDPQVRTGHVHLKVADLQRALRFYSGILGFEVTQRYGDGAVFLSAGGYHHHIALNTWESLGGFPPPSGTTGLYHTAILYPTRAALAAALRRVLAANTPLEGAADHGVSESIYLRAQQSGDNRTRPPVHRAHLGHRMGFFF
jgi:catechol 2,3-dioxygenase